MRKLHFPVRTIVIAFAAIVSALTSVTMTPQDASAVGTENRGTRNQAEAAARSLCFARLADGTGNGGAYGAIWFTGSAGSYYSMGVTAGAFDTNVQVYIRGSVYGCKLGALNSRYYAICVRPSGVNGFRLSIYGQTPSPAGWNCNGNYPPALYRGQLAASVGNPNPTDGPWDWTTTGNTLTGNLNINGIGAPGTSTTFPIDLFRCMSNNGTNVVSNSCYAQEVLITVIREPAPTPPPTPVTWTVTGTSTIGKSSASMGTAEITAKPGDTVYWAHSLRNNGPSNMNSDVSYSVPKSGFSQPAWQLASPSGSARGNNDTTFVRINNAQPAPNNGFTAYTVQASDVGRTLCQRMSWTPTSTSNGAATETPNRCVKIMASVGVSRDLVMNPPDGSIADDGSEVKATFFATNPSPINVSVKYTAWAWYEKTGGPEAYNSGDDRYFNESTAGWPPGESGAQAYEVLPPASYDREVTVSLKVADITAGGKICAAWRIESLNEFVPTETSGFDVQCVWIGYKPKVQVWGNDIRVGSAPDVAANKSSKVAALLSQKKDETTGAVNYFGSWGEYGILAPDDGTNVSTIRGIASGAMLNNPAGITTPNQSEWSKLTFANDSSVGCVYGCFTTSSGMGVLPDVEGYLDRNGLVLGNVTQTSGTYNISSNIDADPAGVQRIIIADNIRISDSVTEVNAWLIARNSIDTCAKGSEPITISECTGTLRINGPVMARELRLRRVGNVAADKTNAVGEIVNLRGDVYKWAHKTTHDAATYTTTSLRDLAPRY